MSIWNHPVTPLVFAVCAIALIIGITIKILSERKKKAIREEERRAAFRRREAQEREERARRAAEERRQAEKRRSLINRLPKDKGDYLDKDVKSRANRTGLPTVKPTKRHVGDRLPGKTFRPAARQSSTTSSTNDGFAGGALFGILAGDDFSSSPSSHDHSRDSSPSHSHDYGGSSGSNDSGSSGSSDSGGGSFGGGDSGSF